MMSGLVSIDWRDLTEAAPTVVTCLMMPLTFSIAEGISLGFIAYAAIKLFSGKGRSVSLSVWVMAAILSSNTFWRRKRRHYKNSI